MADGGAATGAGDGQLALLTPQDDVARPELSIVIPALNEEITISEFVEWCKQGLDQARISGEILIVDSSTDRTAELALAGGARVLKAPKRGLGRAYIDALPYVRGTYIIMGDADCTYDFRELGVFVEKFRDGAEFIMGSRFKGWIEPGSMPALHRYFGTPGTTWILNVLYASHFSDIHCGMRGITRDALQRMRLSSQSWEYASEMVLKSVHMGLATTEVPVRFLKDQEGRVSHHKRSGWLSPWKAAWINLKSMFIYGADFFLFRPGIVILLLGLVIVAPLTAGTITIGPITFSLYAQLLGVMLVVVGLQSFYLGCLAQVFQDYQGTTTRRWMERFPYTRTVVVAAVMFLAGFGLIGFLFDEFLRSGLKLPAVNTASHVAVTGILLMVAGFMTFTFTLLLHAAALREGRGLERSAR
ncbi:MAG: glycosyltransferase family 2 protein [Actinomycetota bacterium]